MEKSPFRVFVRLLVRAGSLARRGFTIIELLVTLVILSVIAAVLYPVVVEQVGRADPVRVAHDLASVRTAIDLFHLQTRTAYPLKLDDLIRPITVADEQPDARLYTAQEVSGWRGPYLNPSLLDPDGDIPSGSNVDIQNAFVLFEVSTTAGAGDSPPAVADFLAVKTTIMNSETFEAVNDIIDGPAEPDGWGPGKSMQAGRLRLVPPFPPITLTEVSGSVFYLAIPY